MVGVYDDEELEYKKPFELKEPIVVDRSKKRNSEILMPGLENNLTQLKFKRKQTVNPSREMVNETTIKESNKKRDSISSTSTNSKLGLNRLSFGSAGYKLVTNKYVPEKPLKEKKIKLKRKLTAHVVTRWYRAPELILMEKQYGYEIDIWSAG